MEHTVCPSDKCRQHCYCVDRSLYVVGKFPLLLIDETRPENNRIGTIQRTQFVNCVEGLFRYYASVTWSLS